MLSNNNPNEGSGSVSLNMPDAGVSASPNVQIAPTPEMKLGKQESVQPSNEIASFSLGNEPTETVVEPSLEPTNLDTPDLHVPINSSLEPETDLVEDLGSELNTDSVPADLKPTEAETQTNSFFKQPNFKLWSGILGGSLILLVGVFFFLAQQTTIFQGTVTRILEDEPILESSEPVIDTSNEATEPTATPTGQTPNSNISDGIISNGNNSEPTENTGSINAGNIGEPVVDDADSDLADLLADTTTPLNGDAIIITDGGNTNIDLPNTSTTNNTNNPLLTSSSTNGTIVINDPAFNNPGTIPTDSIIIGNQTTSTNQNAQANMLGNMPTLTSNTSTAVLGSAEVQGNTGPGMLIYFLGPIGFVIYRKRRIYGS